MPLSSRYAVYVPGTRGTSGDLAEEDRQKYVRETLRRMGGVFGGATAQDAMGSWLAENGELVLEHITVVFSFAAEKTEKYADAIRGVAAWLREELDQEAVSMETPDGLDFVMKEAA